MASFQDQLVDLIAEESGLAAASLRSSSGLMSTGILDSFALVTVITYVERALAA